MTAKAIWKPGREKNTQIATCSWCEWRPMAVKRICPSLSGFQAMEVELATARGNWKPDAEGYFVLGPPAYSSDGTTKTRRHEGKRFAKYKGERQRQAWEVPPGGMLIRLKCPRCGAKNDVEVDDVRG